MIVGLKGMFQVQTRVERLDTSKALFSCGHWKRNRKKYLAEMKRNKGSRTSSSGINVIQINLATSPTCSWVFDTGSVAHDNGNILC